MGFNSAVPFWLKNVQRLYVVNCLQFQFLESHCMPRLFLYGSWRICKMAALVAYWLKHFQLLQNYCMWSYQTNHKSSSNGPQEVLFLFKVMQYPTWPPNLLIDWDIWSVFAKLLQWGHQLVRNVPLGVLKEYLYLLEQFEIQYGCLDLWLDLTIFNTFPEKLHEDFAKMFH